MLEGPLREQTADIPSGWRTLGISQIILLSRSHTLALGGADARGDMATAEMGLLTFLRPGKVMQAHSQPALNGLLELKRKNQSCPTGCRSCAKSCQRVPGASEQATSNWTERRSSWFPLQAVAKPVQETSQRNGASECCTRQSPP